MSPGPTDSDGEVVTSTKRICLTVEILLKVKQAVWSISVKRQMGTHIFTKREGFYCVVNIC